MQDVEDKVEIICKFCAGTGKRPASEFFHGHHMPHTNPCHQCGGEGKYLAVRVED